MSSERPSAPRLPSYRFGVEPERPVRRLSERFGPLIDHINAQVSGFQVELESALTYSAYLRRVRAARFDFGLFEPNLVLEAERLGYRVFARTGRSDRIAGVIVARRDANIRRLADLKGKAVCFGSPDALASTMLARLWLRRAGLREGDIDAVFTGSQESALLEVFAGNAAAASASRAGWREFRFSHPEESMEMEVKWRTEELTGPALMAHARIPRSHAEQVAHTLFQLKDTAPGRSLLEGAMFSEFHPAVSGSYDDVWEFLNDYRRSFGARALPAVLP